MLTDLLDGCNAQNVQQSTVGINLTITVIVVGIVHVFLRMATGALQNPHDVVARQVGFGL